MIDEDMEDYKKKRTKVYKAVNWALDRQQGFMHAKIVSELEDRRHQRAAQARERQ